MKTPCVFRIRVQALAALGGLLVALSLIAAPPMAHGGPIWGGAVFMDYARRYPPGQVVADAKGQCYAACYAIAKPCHGRAQCAARAPGCYEACDNPPAAAPAPAPTTSRPPSRVAACDMPPRFG